MDLFLSHFTHRLDAKGRVSIPAPFRAILAGDGFAGLYVYRALEAAALDCGGNGLLAQITGVLSSLQPFTPAHDSFSTALLGMSEVLKLDTEGRVLLPDGLKAHADILGEVTFVGLGQKFQIWEPTRFRQHLEEAQSRLRAMRQQPWGTHMPPVQGECQ